MTVEVFSLYIVVSTLAISNELACNTIVDVSACIYCSSTSDTSAADGLNVCLCCQHFCIIFAIATGVESESAGRYPCLTL